MYLRNKFLINLVSLAGLRHEKEIKFLKRVIACGTDGWTWTDDPAHSKKLVDELNLGGAKGAATSGSEATPANAPRSEDNLTSQKAERYRSLAGRLLYHSLYDPRVQCDDTGLVVREYTQGARGAVALSGALDRGSTGCGLAVSLAGRRRNIEASRLGGRRSRSLRRERAQRELVTGIFGWPLVDPGRWATNLRVAMSSGESEFHALALCAARLTFTRSLVDGFGFLHVEGQPARTPSSAVAMVLESSSTFWSGVFGNNRHGRTDR